jgi:uncharacterized membrane-anchored protein YhcB (DUF1043 family)
MKKAIARIVITVIIGALIGYGIACLDNNGMIPQQEVKQVRTKK